MRDVVLLDNFPTLRVKDNNRAELLFMRNVFRTFKLPVIINSTNGILQNKIDYTRISRPELDVCWCVVVPTMPRFQLPPLVDKPRDDLATLIEHSHPLFARFALEYTTRVQLYEDASDQQVIDYMDELTLLSLPSSAWCGSIRRLDGFVSAKWLSF